MEPHIKCKTGDVSDWVLLPGDPGRNDIITKFWDVKKEVAYNREFRTCRGRYKDIDISVTSTGIGCPSTAIAIEELANIGVKGCIRIGTCGGLLKEMQPGDIVIPSAAACLDGTTREYDTNAKITYADKAVIDALINAAKKAGVKYFVGINRTHDVFYEPMENFTKLAGKGFTSSEMECSAVFFVSALRKLKAGAILVVNTPEPPEEVLKEPTIIYKLVDANKVNKGVEDAVKIALEAVSMLTIKHG